MKKYLLISLVFASCATPKTIESIKYIYKNNIQKDSIYIEKRDSVNMYIKGDTVFNYRERILTSFKIRLQKDTVLQKDTIKSTIYIKEKPSKTKFIGVLDYILLAIIALFLIYNTLKFFKIIK